MTLPVEVVQDNDHAYIEVIANRWGWSDRSCRQSGFPMRTMPFGGPTTAPSAWGGRPGPGDVQRAKGLAMRLECGTAWVNTHSTIQPNAPFGGVKESGFGVGFGRDGLVEFTSIQTAKVAGIKDMAPT